MSDEHTECPFCRGLEHKQLASRVRFDLAANVYECASCHLVFLDQNSFTYPEDFYEKAYHQTYITHIEPAAFEPEAYYHKMVKATAKWSEKLERKLTGEEVVLDVGCSTGHFMKAIEGRCKKIYGHELNRKEIDFCKKKTGAGCVG